MLHDIVQVVSNNVPTKSDSIQGTVNVVNFAFFGNFVILIIYERVFVRIFHVYFLLVNCYNFHTSDIFTIFFFILQISENCPHMKITRFTVFNYENQKIFLILTLNLLSFKIYHLKIKNQWWLSLSKNFISFQRRIQQCFCFPIRSCEQFVCLLNRSKQQYCIYVIVIIQMLYIASTSS